MAISSWVSVRSRIGGKGADVWTGREYTADCDWPRGGEFLEFGFPSRIYSSAIALELDMRPRAIFFFSNFFWSYSK